MKNLQTTLLTTVAAVLLLGLPSLAASSGAAEQSASGNMLFPRPAELEGDVRFWRRIYTEVGTDGGFIHDPRDLRVVYEVVEYPSGTSRRTRDHKQESVKRGYRNILLSLARGKRTHLDKEERRVLALFPEDVSDKTLRTAAGNVRFQRGQADKFRAGLIRSGAWRSHIIATLREMGLPEELVALPHVESSYTPYAYSHVGAAGLWQFTRSTGKRYMRVDSVIDERMDPLIATVAAARLLQHNRQSTGTWPLALTAYNHGAAGMRRASRQVGTTDIGVIVRKYRSRTFGFASRNFYVEFLAALEVDRNAERYFGDLPRHEPVTYDTVTLPSWVPAKALAAALDVTLDTLKKHNPSLGSAIFSGSKRVPKDFELRMPRSELARPLEALIAGIPAEQRYAKQTRDTYHNIRRGESLSVIAARYNVSISELVELNGLRSRHSIRAGQKLRLPEGSGRGRSSQQAAVASIPRPVVAPTNGVHTVRRGETISRIASRYGVGEQQLLRWNGIRNRHRIHVGQRLRVATVEPVILADASPPSSRADYDARDAKTETETRAAAVEPVEKPQPVGVAEADPTEAGPLQADPNDYSVAPNDSIEVQAAETLGHYAEWLDVRASTLRGLNGMHYSTPLVVGDRLRLDFSEISQAQFEARRTEHHQSLQQAFFEQNEIVGTKTHVIRSGDSIWTLAQRRDLPLWLLRQYNPDVDFGDLHAGARLALPAVRPRRTN